MQDIQSYSELKEKSLEIILNYKPSEKYDKAASDELQKLKDDVKRAITLLPKDEKDIIEFRYYQNLSSEQIAERVGISQDEVNKTILKAIEGIKINLNDGLTKNTISLNAPEIPKIKSNENLKPAVISANIGSSPSQTRELPVATKENGVVITSPDKSNALYTTCNASVPFETNNRFSTSK